MKKIILHAHVRTFMIDVATAVVSVKHKARWFRVLEDCILLLRIPNLLQLRSSYFEYKQSN